MTRTRVVRHKLSNVIGDTSMGRKNVYIEQRDDGKFAVLRPNAQRASAVRDTQGAAIDAAKQMFPDVKPDIERVRHTKSGQPDQWRKQ
jgi:hypothetical protein